MEAVGRRNGGENSLLSLAKCGVVGVIGKNGSEAAALQVVPLQHNADFVMAKRRREFVAMEWDDVVCGTERLMGSPVKSGCSRHTFKIFRMLE